MRKSTDISICILCCIQEYLEQWHLLANLESDLPSETHSEEQQESSAFFQNNGPSASTQGAEPNNDHQEKVQATGRILQVSTITIIIIIYHY